MEHALDLSVVVPALNEEANVAAVLQSVRRELDACAIRYEILVVDDGSSDETGLRARGVEGVQVVRHPRNRGYGAALKTGIRRARGERILIFDADGTLPAHRIPDLVARMHEYDMVVAARVGRVRVPWRRRAAKAFLRELAYVLTSVRIPDLNSGMRIFRKADAKRFMSILPSGFSFTSTITLAFLTNDYTIEYLPIDFEDDAKRSHVRPLRDFPRFVALVVRVVTYFNPLRVYLPLAGLLLLVDFAYTGWTLAHGEGLTDAGVLLPVLALQLAAIGLMGDFIAKRGLPEEE